MAATDLFRRAPPAPAGALPQTPALLRDGNPETVAGGTGAGIFSPGGHQCHRTPGQVKGAFGVAREGASAPLAPSVEPAAPPGCPTRRCPTPQATARRGRRRINRHHHNEQMFDKNKAEKSSTWVEQGATGLP